MSFIKTCLVLLAIFLEFIEGQDIDVQPARVMFKGVAYTLTPQKMAWLEAGLFCEAHGGKLAVDGMKTKEEILELRRLLSAPSGQIWVGLHEEQGQWKYWGEKEESLSIPWERNEPSDGWWNCNCHEDCGSLMDNGMINDYLCETPIYAICQFGERDPRADMEPQIDSLQIRGTIVSRFAETVITSYMRNPSIVAKEAEFSLMTPTAAFITNLTMTTGGRTIVGSVQEKEKAEKIYDLAKKRGKTAGKVASRGISFSVFKTSLLVAPNETVIFELSYQQLLSRRHGLYDYSVSVNPQQLIKHLSLEVDIYETSPFTKVKVLPIRTTKEARYMGGQPQKDGEVMTKNFFVETENYVEGAQINLPVDDPATCRVTYNPTMTQQKELSPLGLSGVFSLQYDVDGNGIGGTSIVQNGYFAHFFAPPFPPQPRVAVFVMDVSGSMYGHKIDQSKQALIETLTILNKEDYFNIIKFSSGSEKLFEDMVLATEENLNTARDFVENFSANGGTNALSGFTDAINTITPFLPAFRCNVSEGLCLNDGACNEETNLCECKPCLCSGFSKCECKSYKGESCADLVTVDLYYAAYPFTATLPDEISLEDADIVQVDSDSDFSADWLLVNRQGQSGWVPTQSVAKIDIPVPLNIMKYSEMQGFCSQRPKREKQTKKSKSQLASTLESVLSAALPDSLGELFSYKYDGGYNINERYNINDGGNDMYDGGNEIQLTGPCKQQQVYYDKIYQFEEFEFASSATQHPFHGAMWINGQVDESISEYDVGFQLKVTSDFGADGRGNWKVSRGEFTKDGYDVNYAVFQVNTPKQDDPTICEVYYLISNQDKWGSSGDLTLNSKFMNNTHSGSNIVSVTSDVTNSLLGYTLLSRTEDFFEEEAIEEYIANLVDNVASARDEDVDECAKDNGDCRHGACVNTDGSYYCDCQVGFIGQLCDQRSWSAVTEPLVRPNPRPTSDVESGVATVDKYDQYSKIIMFQTDGQFNDRSGTVKVVREKHQGRFDLHSIAFGSDADIPTLNEMSLITGGRVEQIFDDIDASAQMRNFLSESASPVLRNLEFHYSREKLTEVVGAKLKTLYKGGEFVITGKVTDFDRKGAVAKRPKRMASLMEAQITGFVGKEKHSFPFVMEPNPRVDEIAGNIESFTEKLWALKRIKELLNEMKLEKNETLKAEIRERALNMSLEYNFVTTLTSMIVIKPEDLQVIEESLDDSVEKLTKAAAVQPSRRITPQSAGLRAGLQGLMTSGRNAGSSRSSGALSGGITGGISNSRIMPLSGNVGVGPDTNARIGGGMNFDGMFRAIGGSVGAGGAGGAVASVGLGAGVDLDLDASLGSAPIDFNRLLQINSGIGGSSRSWSSNTYGAASIYADPHIVIPLEDDMNLCFNLKSKDQQVITLLHDREYNHSVNTLMTVTNGTYMTSISIIDFTRDFSLMINLDSFSISLANRRSMETMRADEPMMLQKQDVTILNEPTQRAMLIKGRNFEYHVLFKPAARVPHLDLFIHDYDSLKNDTDLRGVIGEFLHQPATVVEKGQDHFIHINQRTSHVIEKERFIVKGVKMAYDKVSCWHSNSWQKLSKHPLSDNIRQELLDVPHSAALKTNTSLPK